MRPETVDPQVIPPRRSRAGNVEGVNDETLELLASLLDDIFRVPGTSLRFGLDPVIGLIPGIGDLITGLASFLIIFAAWQRQLPTATVARMVSNVAIDSLVGTIPFLGDAFDVAWKSNRKNMHLLRRATADTSRQQGWRDWFFLLGLVVAMGILVAIPIAVLYLLIHLLRHA